MNQHTKGFTLIEILVSIAIVGILATLATVGYQEYISRARAADILLKYDAIKAGAALRTSQQSASSCSDLLKTLDTSNLADAYATLNYGFEAASGGGYRPVLTVCGKTGAGNPWGARVAKGAYDTMLKAGTVEKGAVVTDAVVSFALPLTSGNQAICKTWTTPVANTSCAANPVATTSAQSASTPSSTTTAANPQTLTTATTIAPLATTTSPPQAVASQPLPVPPKPVVTKVVLAPKITGATALSAFTGAQRGVPIGTQIVGLYLAGSSLNQLENVPPGQLPRVSGGYTTVADAGYQYLAESGGLGRLMPTMAANLRPLSPSERNAWDGGIVVFSDGTVGRMQKAANGNGSEKDYVYFSVLDGVNANQGMAVVSGTAGAGQSIQIKNGATVLATLRADAQGNWNFAGPAGLAGSGQSLTAVAVPWRYE